MKLTVQVKLVVSPEESEILRETLTRRQSRYQHHINHCISKEIVKTAVESKKALAFEDLKGIRQRVTVKGKEFRRMMGNWAFSQLATFSCYKSQRSGVRVITVDPRNTSRECPECHYIDKANRRMRDEFRCIECGFDGPADHIAARNIGVRGAISFALLSAARVDGQA